MILLPVKHGRNFLRDKIAWIRRKILLECCLPTGTVCNAAIPVIYRFGSESDVNRLTLTAHDYDEEAKRFAIERLRSGDRLVLGEYLGDIVFYGWIMFGQMDLGYRSYRPISKDTAYVYKLFTVKEHRGRRVLPGFYRFVAMQLEEIGIKRMLCWVNSTNVPSLKSHTRCGFLPIGSFYEIQLFGKTHYVLTRQARLSIGDQTQAIPRKRE
ncbi:MAG: GNAT family N-acetyltransferase [Verrucomicrobiae bacterium]|nr:GNAT family N-acetyltransferase [Verrucomicrobiae bacterium]